jgi:hypothetical protein
MGDERREENSGGAQEIHLKPVTISFSMRVDEGALSRSAGWESTLEAELRRVVAKFGGKEFTLGRTTVGPSNDTLQRVLPFLVEHASLASVVRCAETCKQWKLELQERGFHPQILRLCSTLSGPIDVTNIHETLTAQDAVWARRTAARAWLARWPAAQRRRRAALAAHFTRCVGEVRGLKFLPALWEALRSAWPSDAPAMVLSVALRKARARSIKLWGERHSRATTAAVDQGFGPVDQTVIFALKILAAKRAKEEASWGLTGGANSAVFTPAHNPNKVRWGYLQVPGHIWVRSHGPRNWEPLQFWHSYKFDLLAADGNSATFPLCKHEADLPLEPELPPGVAAAPPRRAVNVESLSLSLQLIADDAAFFALHHKAHERLISVLPTTLRAPLHADTSELDTLVPPAGAWGPRPIAHGQRARRRWLCWIRRSTPNQKPETRTRDPTQKSEIRNKKPEVRNHELQASIKNPQNLNPQTINPQPSTPQSKP